MVDSSALLAVAVIAFGMAVTPGPNVIYLMARSVEEGRRSGLLALGGVSIGYLLHLTAAVLGLSAVLTAVPQLYSALQLAGAAYLAWLAWRALRGRRTSGSAAGPPPATIAGRSSSPVRLMLMGALTNVLNPKAPLMYVSLIPQFIDLEAGHLAGQAAILGGTHIVVSLAAHVCLVCGAGSFAAFLQRRPSWLRTQRYATALLLGVFAAELLVSGVGTAITGPATPGFTAISPPATKTTAAPPGEGKYYVVGPPVNGKREHLFGIAAKTLGDGRRYRRMTDPLVVEPGWVLLLPADAHGSGVVTGVAPWPAPAPEPADARWWVTTGQVMRGTVLLLALALWAWAVLITLRPRRIGDVRSMNTGSPATASRSSANYDGRGGRGGVHPGLSG
jgi:threonine/homoserine/homoserine lactone efflux protein